MDTLYRLKEMFCSVCGDVVSVDKIKHGKCFPCYQHLVLSRPNKKQNKESDDADIS